MMKLSRRVKMELVTAIIMAIVLSALAAYVSQPRQSLWSGVTWSESGDEQYLKTGVQRVISENIRGELRKGSFETVVGGLKNSTAFYGGNIPLLNMLYENEIWTGSLSCKVPTENVTSFTFDARLLISTYGKVTHISISVTETPVNQTQQAEELSSIGISLSEVAGGDAGSSIINQIGIVVPWLTTSLVWIAQGLIIGLPLCFVSLGIVVLVERGIVPAWKRQFKDRSMSKASVEAKIE
jgi:hypothetical protein